jgi:hypothetical protein
LFHELNIMLRLIARVPWQQAIYFVEKDDGRLLSLALANKSVSFLTDAPVTPPSTSAAVIG